MSYARSPRPLCSTTIGTRPMCSDPPMNAFIGLRHSHLKPGLLAKQREYLPLGEMRACPVAVLGAAEHPLRLGRRSLHSLPFRGASQRLIDVFFGNGYRLGAGDRIQQEIALDAPFRQR